METAAILESLFKCSENVRTHIEETYRLYMKNAALYKII